MVSVGRLRLKIRCENDTFSQVSCEYFADFALIFNQSSRKMIFKGRKNALPCVSVRLLKLQKYGLKLQKYGDYLSVLSYQFGILMIFE